MLDLASNQKFWETYQLSTRMSSAGLTCFYLCFDQEVSLLKKIHVLYSFFFVRRVIAPIVTFCFYCVVIPVSILVPEVEIPVWGLVYIPTTITILNAVRNPR